MPWPPLGLTFAAGTASLYVWAPLAHSLGVRGSGETIELDQVAEGVWGGDVAIDTDESYVLLLDGARDLPDPCSRWQPAGLRGPSRALDPAGFAWTDQEWTPPGLAQLVVYELHVGTFTPDGTFDAAATRLESLAELGVTAVELMPVATFAGARGWGYDGVLGFAAHETYGGPRALARFVDAAHAAGVGVLLDVVYNHLGPGSELITDLAPYVSDEQQTLWGGAMDFQRRGVREWAIQNAEMWVRDYHVDGLRLDAVNAIQDSSKPHVLQELAERVRAVQPGTLVISETEIGDTRPLTEWGHDAQWQDALHHAAHVLLTGEQDGYYASFGKVADLAAELTRPEGRRFVVCAQNHDQVGNRAFGDRLRGDRLRLAAFAAILSRGTPLLFMGEEYDESNPFLFFTDHDDPAIADATREGRRKEFERFAAFSGADIPDPQDIDTFLASKLEPGQGDATTTSYYRRLLELRAQLVDEPAEVDVDEERRLLRVRRGPIELLLNFSDDRVDGVAPWSGDVRELGAAPDRP